MRILHLTSFLQGGAGLVIATLAAAQRAAGHDVTVVTSATAPAGYGNYPAHLERLARAAVTTHTVDSLFTRQAADHQPVIDFIEAQGGAAAFDVIHAHAGVPARIALTLRERASGRAAVLQTMHGWGVAKTAEQAAADLHTLNTVDAVVVPASTSARLLESLGVTASRISVVPYGVAARAAAPPANDALYDDIRGWRRRGGRVLCCAGTIGERKNQRLLIDALPVLGEDNVLVVFIGEGEVEQLRDHAEHRGVAAQVRFSGYRRDAREVAAECDWLVLPSRSEGQPLAILEAFCDRVPTLASAIPELQELIDDGVTGVLFPPDDPAAAARTLSRALALPDEAREALVARAHDRWDAVHRLDRMTDSYMAVYRRL